MQLYNNFPTLHSSQIAIEILPVDSPGYLQRSKNAISQNYGNFGDSWLYMCVCDGDNKVMY